MDSTEKSPETDPPSAPQEGAGGRGSKPRDERAERLAAALRANLARRKSARRAGLADFGAEAPGEDDE